MFHSLSQNISFLTMSKVKKQAYIVKGCSIFLICCKVCKSLPENELNNGKKWRPFTLLTLTRATSGSLARCRGGVSATPHLSWLWSNFWPKNQVSLQAGINSNSFGWFSEFFFQNSQKNWRKLKTYQKLLKMSENSKFCNFWAISTCNTSKESIFLIEFNFTEKKYDLFENFLKKSNFSDFFSKLMLTTCLCLLISQICAKKFQNWVHLCFGEVLKLKLIKGELIIYKGIDYYFTMQSSWPSSPSNILTCNPAQPKAF